MRYQDEPTEYSVETITDPDDRGTFRDFKSLGAARRYAIKQSLKEGVIETFLHWEGYDKDGYDDEGMEYYSNGKLKIKIV